MAARQNESVMTGAGVFRAKPAQRRLSRESAAVLVALVLVLSIAYAPGLAELFAPWNRMSAELSAATIAVAGLPVQVRDTLLIHPDGFCVEIVYSCTGLVPGLFILTWLFALRQGPWIKLIGLASGIGLVLGVNLLRLLVTYYVGATSPTHLGLVHDVLGQGAVVLSTAAFMVSWHYLSTARSWRGHRGHG